MTDKEKYLEMTSMMKEIIELKSECMIDSYSKVLAGTKDMLNEHFSEENELDSSEIAKRADMFWNIALQRVDREKQEASQQMQMSQQMPQTMQTPRPTESPCAKKAKENAKKIATLEAEIKDTKDK